MLSNAEKLDLAYKICSSQFGVNLKSNSRKRVYIYGRACFFMLTRKHTYCSLEQIGSYLNKHHATVMHGIKEFEYMVKYEPALGESYSLIEDRFLNKMEETVVDKQESSAEVFKMRLKILEAELKKLRMVEREYLKLTDKKAVVYNEHIGKLVLL